jgi:hypothetical protein
VALLASRASQHGRPVAAPRSVWRLVPWVLILVALGLGLLSLLSARQSAIGPYGLIQALPPGYFVSLVVLAAAFLMTWLNHEIRYSQFITEVVALVLLLQGAPAVIEAEPRFHEAWTHAGFTNYVAQTGQVLPHIDARFDWPSFFTGVALLAHAGGLPSAILLLRWYPVFINLLYLPPFFLLARQILRDEKKALLVVWIFPLANWVGQDYYSPQSVAYLLYLVFACLVLGPFGANRRALLPQWLRALFPPWRRQRQRDREHQWDRGRARTRPEEQGDTRRGVMILLAIMLVVSLAMATGHQLTPYFAFVAVAGLAIFGRTKLVAWPAVMFTVATGWVCYGAIAFWQGHFLKIFGGLGHLGTNLSASLSKRLRGSPAHYQVLDVRLLMVVLVLTLALAGFFLGRRTTADRRAAVVLTLVPALALGGQAYGGEAGLRVFLFQLPGALCLAALALTAAPGRLRAIAVASLIALLIPGFLVARWGNELSEMVPADEIMGMRVLYAMAPPGSVFLSINPQVPWEFMDIGQHKYITNKNYVSAFAFGNSLESVAARLKGPQGGYVVITESEIVYAQQSYGLGDWARTVERRFAASPLFRRVYQNPDLVVYQYAGGQHNALPNSPKQSHTSSARKSHKRKPDHRRHCRFARHRRNRCNRA